MANQSRQNIIDSAFRLYNRGKALLESAPLRSDSPQVREMKAQARAASGPDPEANLGYISKGHDRFAAQGGYAPPRSATDGPGNSVLIQRADGSTTSRVGGTRAWRNNNPGNITSAGDFARSAGAIGSAGRFAVFPDVSTGADAIDKLLKTPEYRARDLGGAVHRYAPPHENDTERYIQLIERATGVARTTPMAKLTDQQRTQMVNAIMRHEGWRTGQEKPTP